MLLNHLQLNTEKTKALVITKRNNFISEEVIDLKISSEKLIQPVYQLQKVLVFSLMLILLLKNR